LNSRGSSTVVQSARQFQSSLQRGVEQVGGPQLALAAAIILGAVIAISATLRSDHSGRPDHSAQPDAVADAVADADADEQQRVTKDGV